jgi:hypothetical protein
MENSSYGYARLWLRTSARALLQCHKYISDKEELTASDKIDEDFLSQIRTYLDQLDVSELIEVINYLTNDIGNKYDIANMPEQKFLCYRGVKTKYIPIETSATNVETLAIDSAIANNETSNPKKKARYYRGALIE